MKMLLVKAMSVLMPFAFLLGFMHAQTCDYNDLQERYAQEKQNREKIAQDYERLRKAMAKQQQGEPKKVVQEKETVLAVINRNPLNVKRAATKWQGQKGIDEQGHIIFESNVHGVRAAASVLMNYYAEHKIDTLYGIVDRFCTAPAKRKATYAAFIGKRLGLKTDKPFNVLERMPELLAAMARFESGREWPKELFAPYSLLASAYTKGGK